jgi:hypothetical protein
LGGFNTQVGVHAERFDRDRGIEHAKLVGQAGIINLQGEPGVDHGFVLALEHRRHRIDLSFPFYDFR